MLHNLACLEPTPANLFFPPKRGDYTYFESQVPQPGSPVEVQAAWAADAAMLAYARYGSTRMNQEEFEGILRDAGLVDVHPIGHCFVDNAATARGFFAGNDAHAVLAFRGTEKDNAHDIAADADFLLVDGPAGRIHLGFRSYFESVRTKVAQLVSDYRSDHPNQSLFITGHSLGGALATLAFVTLSDPASSLYTFGCPRVGDRRFCAEVEALAASRACYRTVDNEDVVTHVPFPVPGLAYDHPEVTLLLLDPVGALKQNPLHPPRDRADLAELALGFVRGTSLDRLCTPLPRPLADHSVVRYCHYMAGAIGSAN